MLCEYKTKEELQKLHKKTESLPDFINLHFDISTLLDGNFDELSNRYFCCETENKDLLVILFTKFSIPSYRPRLIFCYNSDAEFGNENLGKIFDELNSILNFTNIDNLWTDVSGKMNPIYKEWFSLRFPEKTLFDNPCFLFYMSKEQKENLQNECKNGIQILDEYFFDNEITDKDIEIIIDTWRYSDMTEFDLIKALFKNMPFSLIRDKATYSPISFEHSDNRGCINHLFTFSDHRNKGLGTAVEKDLCLKMIRKNMTPFKYVEVSNLAVAKSTKASKWWTLWENGKEGEVIQHWMKIEN